MTLSIIVSEVSSPPQSVRILTAEPEKPIKWRLIKEFPHKNSALDLSVDSAVVQTWDQ